MSVLGQLVNLRYLSAVDAAPRNGCTERLRDGAANDSEIRRGAALPSADSDRTVYWLMLVVGMITLTAALVQGGTWGVGPTVGALFCVFAIRSLLVAYIVRVREQAKKGTFGSAKV